MKHGDKIKIDGKVVTVYECDRKARCNRSRDCGKLCKFTPDIKHAVKDKQLSFLEDK